MTSSKRASASKVRAATRRNSTPSPDAFKELSRRVGALLREHDFRGSGQNFTRNGGKIWQGVSLQRSRWTVSSAEPVRFYLNFGLYFADLPSKRFDWRKVYGDFRAFRPAGMDLHLRSSELTPRAESSWEIDEESLERVWRKVRTVLRATLVPVLDWTSTREGAIEFCQLIPWHLNRAVRAWLRSRAPDPWTPDVVEAKRLREALARRVRTLDTPVPTVPPKSSSTSVSSPRSTRSRKVRG